VSITLVGVVKLVGVCDFGNEGARIFGEGVEEDAVDDDGDRLRESIRQFL
jgi:hypothetical protein